MESEEKYEFQNPGIYTIVHKSGVDDLPAKNINFIGNIDSPKLFIEKRKECADGDYSINQFDARLTIDREGMSIGLHLNETCPYTSGHIAGVLQLHPDFKKWHINEGHSWSHKELAQFIKMNRSAFTSKQEAMTLSTELMNIRVKVDKEFENSSDNRGSAKSLFAQNVIKSNIPETFKLEIPIFKGQKAEEFEIEVYVDAGDFQVTLVSPEVNDLIALVKNTIIDQEINAIKELIPELVITEQ